MLKRPSLLNRLSSATQKKINSYIPEKVHTTLTAAIKQMIRAVLFGARKLTRSSRQAIGLKEMEDKIRQTITRYRRTAAAEGGITGAGGFLTGLADFPLLLGIKLKMLFDIASLYGFDVKDYKERIYILHIMQLTFSSQNHRRQVFQQMDNWEIQKQTLPEDIHQFDWRNFQQEYRDYIDLAKMAQMLPVIGAAVGVIVNYRLIEKLGATAMNAYRMRLLQRVD